MLSKTVWINHDAAIIMKQDNICALQPISKIRILSEKNVLLVRSIFEVAQKNRLKV